MPAKPPEYLKLMLAVTRQIESTPDGLMDFRNICRDQGHVRAFDLDKKRASDIIRNLEKKTILRPGHYDKFVEILEIIGRDDVIRMLPGYQNYESKVMKDTGNNNTEPHHNTMYQAEKGNTTLEPSQPTDEVITGSVTNVELLKLSESILPKFVLRLGLYLGIPSPVIKTKRLQGGSDGTYSLLAHWKKDVPERHQRQTLLKALKEAGLDDLVSTCFEESGNSSQPDSGPLSRSSIVSEKILCRLANKMGDGWSSFGMRQLGMSKAEIDQFKRNEYSMEETIFEMLYEWRRRNHADATIGKLLDLVENNIDLDSYSFILEELESSE